MMTRQCKSIETNNRPIDRKCKTRQKGRNKFEPINEEKQVFNLCARAIDQGDRKRAGGDERICLSTQGEPKQV